MYITDDGKTRVYITLHDGRTSPLLGCCPNGTVTVDWGDGTEPDVLTGTSTSTAKWTPNHEYAAPGDYVITLTVDGTMGFYGGSSSNQYSGILRHSSGANAVNRVYQNAVQKVEIGSGVTSIGSYAFYNCHSLASITIPDGVTSIGSTAFRGCYSLASITIPDGVTSIGNNAFYFCYSLASITIPGGVTSIGTYAFSDCYCLASITIPDGVTSIGNNAFYNCYSLASITIPGGVTSIGISAFYNCYGVRRYDFTRYIAVPTLPATNAFSGIPADCEIRVPAALAEEWKAATNWSVYADKIVEV
ncbi:MAG: leucine-rich repeat domain-containing protein [Clostridia bacterium]|nr:leucine-rich repeat domain-containing protein [Clostridia bacterium]